MFFAKPAKKDGIFCTHTPKKVKNCVGRGLQPYEAGK